MKLLNSFFGLLLITLLAACSRSTSTNATYPYQVGTFSVTSKSQAQWTGRRGQFNQRGVAIGDTTRFVNPDSLSMLLGVNRESKVFIIDVNDSTINITRADSLNLFDGAFSLSNAPGITIGDASLQGDPLAGTVALHFSGHVQCEDLAPSIQRAAFDYNVLYADQATKSEKIWRHYQLQIDGIGQTLDHLACGAPAPN